MTTITVELPSERLQKLQEMALKLGVSMEELIRVCVEDMRASTALPCAPPQLIRVCVEDMLTQLEEQFRKAALYVLKKNAELYKRLAA